MAGETHGTIDFSFLARLVAAVLYRTYGKRALAILLFFLLPPSHSHSEARSCEFFFLSKITLFK